LRGSQEGIVREILKDLGVMDGYPSLKPKAAFD
jgi:hypothetical protein